MNDHQLWDTTMNLENRTLKQITIDSAAEADQIFAMLMVKMSARPRIHRRKCNVRKHRCVKIYDFIIYDLCTDNKS